MNGLQLLIIVQNQQLQVMQEQMERHHLILQRRVNLFHLRI